MPFIELTIQGDMEIIRMLKLLPNEVRSKIGKNALKKSAKPLVSAVQSKLRRHRRTGALAGSITAVAMRDRFGWPIAVVIGARSGRAVVAGSKRKGSAVKVSQSRKLLKADSGTRSVIPSNYFHLLEYGHSRGRGKSIAPAYPTIRPAFESLGNQVLNQMSADMLNGITRAAKRLGRV